MFRLSSVFLMALAAPFAVLAAAPSASVSPATAKLAPRIAAVASAAVARHTEQVMGAALSRQLFQRNSPLAVRWNAAGQVQVYLHYSNGIPPRTEDLLALGASNVLVSEPLNLVQAWIPADQLNAVAALPEITRVTVPRYAVVKRAPQPVAIPRTGSVDTQGDTILGAQAFRATTGWTGQGTTVGIISNGDDSIAASQKTGDLPATIWNDPNDAGTFKSSGDEGTAMMEIVYDLAPGVKQLGFCGPQTTVDFITCLNDFTANITPNVIVDDLGFPGVAMFTDGGFATAVKNFAISHPDIQLVTAAGNDAQGFWSGTWNGAAVNIKVNGVTYTQAENFGSTNQISFSVQPGDTASWILEWDDPWVDSPPPSGTSNDPNDYDIVLFSSGGAPLACNQGINISDPGPPTNPTGTYQPCNQTNSQPLNTPGPQPIQGDAWTNNSSASASVYLQVFKVAGTPGPNLKLVVNSQKSNVITLNPNTPSGSIFGQSALAFPYEITVGAVSSSNTSSIEPYSSRGPVNLPLIPDTRLKPDIVGVDCVNTTGAGGFSEPFCGTSAAAPHIAGLLALLESAYQGSSKTPFELLQDGAVHLLDSSGTYPNDTYGFGLPDLMSTLNTDPVPLATSFGTPSIITAGTPGTFTGGCLANDSTNGVIFNWNFGPSANPTTSSAQDPSVIFNTAGNFSVSLKCSNSQGVSNTVSQAVTVSPGNDTSGSGKSGGGSLGLLALAVLAFMQLVSGRRRYQP